MSIASFYTTTAVVQEVTTTRNAMSGVANSFSTRIAALKCRLNPKRVTELDERGKLTVRENWVAYCSASSTNKAIKESDRFIISDRTWEVTGIRNPAFRDHHLEIDLREVK